MRGLSYKSYSMVGIGIREEECIGVITTAKRNNKEDSGRTKKYYAEGGKTMIPTLYEPFSHWSDGGSVYILSDIPSIHRVTIDAASLRKK